MTDTQTAILSVFAAAILTAAGARWIAGFQADRDAKQRELDRHLQQEQARLVDQRSLRDQKRERLRGDYEAIAFAASEISGAAVQLGTLLSGDTEEARNARVNERLEEATRDLGRAILRLRLEEGARPLVDAYQAVRALWFQYAEYELPQKRYGEIAETLTKMQAAVDSILEKTKADLDALGKPI